MRIEAVSLTREMYQSMGIGLPTLPMDEPLHMRDLGQCVVTAGKNGSGKTRLLVMLDDAAKKCITPELRQQTEYETAQIVESIRACQAEIERIETQGLRSEEHPHQLEILRKNIIS